MRSDKLILALAVVCLLLTLRCPAHAADQWNAGTLTGSGRTEELTLCYTHSSTTATCIPRRATSVTNALTKYVTTGAGDLTATTASPTAPTLATGGKIMLIGGNSTKVLFGGGGGLGRWLDSSDVSSFSWTVEKDDVAGASGYGFSGVATPTSPDKTYQHSQFTGTSQWVANISIGPWSAGNFAGNSPTAGDQELISDSVNANYYCIVAGEYSSGTPTFRGYTSGTSFAYTTTSASVVMNTGSYYKPLMKMNGLLCVSTHKRQSNSRTYIQSAPIAGTITTIDAGVIDLAPICQFDPSGSQARGWWVNKANGALYKSDSVSAPTAVSNDATYDIPTAALGGSTPLFAICGLDMDNDGVAWNGNNADNPVVFMADGNDFAWWGTPASSGSAPRPKPQRTGPFNNLPFRGP